MNNCKCGKIRLSGAKFVLYDECGKAICCGVTDDKGELKFCDLPLGKYFLREAEAPCGYDKQNEFCEVVIDKCKPHECVEFVNSRTVGSIKVVKYGVDR